MIKFGSLNVKDIRIGEQQVKKVAVGSEIVWEKNASPLPSGYTQVKYLQSYLTQYIDTQIIPNEQLKAEVEFEKKAGGSGNNYYPFGSATAAAKNYFMGSFQLNEQKIWLFFGSGSYYQDFPSASYTMRNDQKTKLVINDEKRFYINDTYVGTVANSPGLNFNFVDAVSIYLFRIRFRVSEPKPTRIYYAKFWDNNVLVGNFIPCLDTNNRPCFYDTVTQQTFYNAGTGEFGYETMDGTIVAPT